MSPRAGATASEADPETAGSPAASGWSELSCGSVIFTIHFRRRAALVARPETQSVSVGLIGEVVGDLAAAQTAVQVPRPAGAPADLAAGGARDRARRCQQHVAH